MRSNISNNVLALGVCVYWSDNGNCMQEQYIGVPRDHLNYLIIIM